MPEENQPSQSLNISGGQLSNVQVGQAGRDLTQTQSIRQGAGEDLSSEEVLTLLSKLEEVLRSSGLPADQQEKAIRHLETVKEEAEAEEPDKGFALKSFQRATKVLQDATTTVEASQGLWQKIQPIAKTLAPWFGVGVNALLLL